MQKSSTGGQNLTSGRKVALHNLGCKVNAYELEATRALLSASGYEIVPFAPGADIYVINTCTVTQIADRKSRQMLHRAKAMNGDAVVVAMGCYAQVPESEKDPAIDIVVGNNHRAEIVRLIESYLESGTRVVSRTDLSAERSYERIEVPEVTMHTRAYIKVQDGCDNFCSYCIIPHVRGRVRSRQKEEVIAEVRALADGGVREIVVTGIHVCSYGKDLEGEDLISLLLALDAIEGISRIRLGSLEPSFFTEDVIRSLAGMRKLCPHFHLSLQSGCDETLKRMNRHYSTEQYREVVMALRAHFKDPALTTDLIVGFPGESEEEFAGTEAFVSEMQFFETHIFPYSRREGTRAASMTDQIDEQTKQERSRRLQAIHLKAQSEFLERFVGKDLEVLLEQQKGGAWIGHTERYQKVRIPDAEGLSAGAIIRVHAVELQEDGCLLGTPCEG